MLSAERRAELSLQRKIGIRKKVLRSYVKNRGINSSPSGVKLFEEQTLLTQSGGTMKRALKDNRDIFAGQDFYIGIDELLGFRNHPNLPEDEEVPGKKVLSADRDLVGRQ